MKVNHYGIPRIDVRPDDMALLYRGLDRDAICADRDGRNLASLFLDELEVAGRSAAGFLLTASDAEEAASLLENFEYELVWARVAGALSEPPSAWVRLGFEPSYFLSDHLSPSCDGMLFPRWHGTDREGVLFVSHFRALNRHGLFETAAEASSFLDFYLSFDWTERGDYYIVEVFGAA